VTPEASSGNCVACHGDIVDNMDDGHYIPSYPKSLVTPTADDGQGLPLNSRGAGAGACDYCHEDDGLAQPVIRNNADLHHTVSSVLEGTLDCVDCHNILDPLDIRTCARCHGPDSLHNIQADSPNPQNLGTVAVGGEWAGYGHVGRDVAAGDSDCWGCHGFSMASAPGTGPIIPTVYSLDVATIRAGSDTLVVLSGASFVNTVGPALFESDVTLTKSDGSSQILTPEIILDQGALVVTIPGDTPPGNYDVRAVKHEFSSNPAVLSVTPQVEIDRAVANRGLAVVYGGGFGGYGAGSGTKVTGTYAVRVGRSLRTVTMDGTVISWSDNRISVRFPQNPKTVTVYSVFGSDMYRILPD
jgi:hypothetical protein